MSTKSTHKKRWTEVNTDWRAIKEEIDNAGHGMKTAIKKDIARRLGLSLDQIHSAIREQFGQAKTINSRTFRNEEAQAAYEMRRRVAYLVVEQKEKMKRAGEGERELSTWRILNLLKDWGVEEAAQCSESSINRIIREEFSYRQATPRTRHEPEEALQEVQVDFSFSKYFSIVDYDKDLGDYILKASSTLLRYKEGDKRMRPMLGVIIDSYSRLRWHHCIAASGESASNTTAFMIQFFQREEDDLVFRHVPWVFKMDNGPLAKSKEGKSFFQSINRPVETSKPYEKTGIGKAERTWQTVWQWEMEVASRIGIGGIIPMSEYNSLLLAECVRLQRLKHPFFSGKTCVDMYQQSILRQNPRPEVINVGLQDAVFTHLERTVGSDQNIRIDNGVYEVPVYAGHYATTGERVRVLIHRDGRMVGELIDHNAESFEIRPFTPTKTGTYRSHKHTFAQDLADSIKNKTTITEQLRKASSTQNSELNTQNSLGPRRLMPKSEELEVQSPFTNSSQLTADSSHKCASKFEALTLVADLLKPHGYAMNDALYAHFEPFVASVNLNRAAITNEVQALLVILNNQHTGT